MAFKVHKETREEIFIRKLRKLLDTYDDLNASGFIASNLVDYERSGGTL